MNAWTHRRAVLAAALLVLAASGGPPARAQDAYPSRPITVIVPFGAGGATDVIARTVADELGRALNTAIIVEARPGANGAIGSAFAARAAHDGYTLLCTAQSTYSLNPNLMKNPLFDQLKDLTPVAAIGRIPWLLAVPADSPFKTTADLVAFGKANPGKLIMPYWQSSVLVTGETLARLGGFKARRAPYKGQVEATTDFLGGRLPVMVTDIAAGRAQIEAGKMRLLGTTTAKRVTAFPDLPTLTEQGFDVVTDSMIAVFAPAGTPQPVIARLNEVISKIVATSPRVRERLVQLGVEPATMTPPEADAFVRSELTRWADLIERAGLQKE